jgi:hypothetical protein
VSRATSIRDRAAKLLGQFQVTDRPIYKRVITRSGGDALLGRPGTVVKTDTLLNPQPAVTYPLEQVTKETLAKNLLVLSGGDRVSVGDYILLVSPNAISKEDILNPDVMFVFAPGAKEEECYVVQLLPSVMNGIDVIFNVLIRSKAR